MDWYLIRGGCARYLSHSTGCAVGEGRDGGGGTRLPDSGAPHGLASPLASLAARRTIDSAPL